MPAVLVVGPSWVGDMVLAQSLFMRLRERPDTVVDVLAPAWSEPLLKLMPQVRNAIPMSVGHGELQLGQRYRIAQTLRATEYEQVIVLPNSLKAALIPFFANIPLRTGYRGEMRFGLLNDVRHLDKRLLSMTVQRFVALGQDADAELPPVVPTPHLVASPFSVAQTLARLQIEPPVGRVIALCPAAEYGPAKRWPAEYFGEVGRQLAAEGWHIWLLGSDKDRAITQKVHAISGGLDLAGRTSLAEAVDLLSLASLILTNDSGLMHVGAALDRPLLAIFGSSSPQFTPPLGARSRIASLNLDCSPCFKRECPLTHLDCLRKLTPRRVLDEINAMVV